MVLEERAGALDLDTIRANAFPADYETDIELPWANPSEILPSPSNVFSHAVYSKISSLRAMISPGPPSRRTEISTTRDKQ